MQKTLYIFSNGELHRKGNTIYFEGEQAKKYIPIENTRELMVFGEVTVNKKFLDFMSQSEIMVHFFNYYGYYSGTFYPREHYNSGYMILQQAEHYMNEEKRLLLAKTFISGAVQNILKVIEYYKNRGKTLEEIELKINELKKNLDNCQKTDEAMAVEGNIREQYYHAFNEILGKKDFEFHGRSRRPPKTRLNALISFGNSLMYTTVLSEIYKTHLDPRIGYLHSTNFRRFSLNLDVAEIFKPIIVDRIIFTLVNKQMLNAKNFEKKLGGVLLNEKGRRVFVTEYDNRLKKTIRHTQLKRNVSYRQLIRLDLYKIQKHLMGEKEYQPYVARW